MRLTPRPLVLVCALLVAGCQVPGTPVAAPFSQQLGPAGPVPAGLEKFYGQTLNWGDCAPFATSDFDHDALAAKGLTCTRLTVPLDYSKPGGDTVTIGVLRKQAGKPEQRIGSLLINPGGPGAAGMSTAAHVATSAAGTALGDRFDFIGFDPRGTGASQPSVHCLEPAERDAERADDLEVDSSAEGVAKFEAQEQDFATKCAQRTEKGAAFLANIGTRDVARDMDVLRSALGDAKLTYLGYSYGTRIGYTYAEAFPGNVRAMVLDGALDPTVDAVTESVNQAQGFEKAFEDYVAWCVKRQDCALGGDPAGAVKAFQGLVRPLQTRPIDVGDGRKLSYEDAVTGAVQALYSEQFWQYLNTGLTELKNNRAGTLMKLADIYEERQSDGSYTSTQDAFTAIRCVDDPPVKDRAVALQAQQRTDELAPFLDDGKGASSALDFCAFWPVANTLQPHLPDATGLPPLLVISTTGDPATPYQSGVKLAEALHGGLLTYESTQHTAFLQGNKCVDSAAGGYLVTGQLPPTGTRCKP